MKLVIRALFIAIALTGSCLSAGVAMAAAGGNWNECAHANGNSEADERCETSTR